MISIQLPPTKGVAAPDQTSCGSVVPPLAFADLERRESLLSRSHGRLPAVFWLFAATCAATSAGLVTFAVIAYHLTQDDVVSVAAAPLIYAAAMAASALAALGSRLAGSSIALKVVPCWAYRCLSRRCQF